MAKSSKNKKDSLLIQLINRAAEKNKKFTFSKTQMRKRMYGLTIALVLAMTGVLIKTGSWQTVHYNEMKSKVKAQQESQVTVTASRGNIYDRNGKVLAESASANNLVCNPQDVKDENIDEISETLADILDMDAADVKKSLNNKNYQYSVIKKKISAIESEKITELKSYSTDEKASDAEKTAKKNQADKYKSIYFEPNSKRYYPYNIASHILGWVNDDNNGASGVESVFDSQLSGKAGSISTTVTGTGKTNRDNSEESFSSASDGNDVVLTIDETIQHLLENHLEKAVKENELKEGATGIVMNPKTGEILAMASKPDFDSNNYASYTKFLDEAWNYQYTPKKDEKKEEQQYDEDGNPLPTATPEPTFNPKDPSDAAIADMRNRMWRNKSVTDTYEPGSTFKVITAAAALEEHVVDDNSSFFCPGFRVVEDRKISCANTSGHGAESFADGVRNSCNPVFMDIALKLGEDKFMEYFRSFGFTEKTGIDLNGESRSLYYTNGMNKVDLATSSFGQGFQITPLQLITAVSAVINGGERMKPHIVKEIKNSDGVVKSYEPEVVNRVISQETSDKMREILESVVSTPGATGKNAYVKGRRIGGKTATSEKIPRGTDARIASFMGFAPANDPEIVCLIVLDEPQVDNKYGGTIAAPIAGELIDEILDYLGIEKQYSDGEKPDETIEIPDVRGLSADEAKKKIVDAGLKYTISGDSSLDIEAQLPKPGVMVDKSSLVVLYTDETDSEKNVTVPSLKGLSVESARERLLTSNLNFEIAGAGHSEASGAYAVNQSIDAGEEVSPGTVVGVEFRQEASD